MTSGRKVLAIFGRRPHLGEGKSRLRAQIGAEGAHAIAQALFDRCIDALPAMCDALGPGGELQWWLTGTPFRPDEPRPNWSGGHPVSEQVEGDLGVRMAHVFQTAWQSGATAVAIMGTDIPGITHEDIRMAFASVESGIQSSAPMEAAIVPTCDGGYGLLCLSRPADFLWSDMPWGTDEVFALTRDRLEQNGFRVCTLPLRRDIDSAEDWEIWQKENNG
jgi:rSAM/selenodomain-associated transferase 1